MAPLHPPRHPLPAALVLAPPPLRRRLLQEASPSARPLLRQRPAVSRSARLPLPLLLVVALRSVLHRHPRQRQEDFRSAHPRPHQPLARDLVLVHQLLHRLLQLRAVLVGLILAPPRLHQRRLQLPQQLHLPLAASHLAQLRPHQQQRPQHPLRRLQREDSAVFRLVRQRPRQRPRRLLMLLLRRLRLHLASPSLGRQHPRRQLLAASRLGPPRRLHQPRQHQRRPLGFPLGHQHLHRQPAPLQRLHQLRRPVRQLRLLLLRPRLVSLSGRLRPPQRLQ